VGTNAMVVKNVHIGGSMHGVLNSGENAMAQNVPASKNHVYLATKNVQRLSQSHGAIMSVCMETTRASTQQSIRMAEPNGAHA